MRVAAVQATQPRARFRFSDVNRLFIANTDSLPMSWYSFIAVALVLVIAAALLVGLWLERRKPPSSG